MGPGICYAQWFMEKTIGNLGEEIGQPFNPFQNISEHGVRQAQVNTLVVLMLDFDLPKVLPSVSKDLRDGYILPDTKEHYAHNMPDNELVCLQQFYTENSVELGMDWQRCVQKWGRLQLPNEQLVCCAWNEKVRLFQNVWIARSIMVCYFFLQKNNNTHSLLVP